MTTHELKAWPKFFQAVVDGRRRFKLRENDRRFCVKDWLRLRECGFATEYTGREATVDVVYIVHGEQIGLPQGMCIVAIGKVG